MVAVQNLLVVFKIVIWVIKWKAAYFNLSSVWL